MDGVKVRSVASDLDREQHHAEDGQAGEDAVPVLRQERHPGVAPEERKPRATMRKSAFGQVSASTIMSSCANFHVESPEGVRHLDHANKRRHVRALHSLATQHYILAMRMELAEQGGSGGCNYMDGCFQSA